MSKILYDIPHICKIKKHLEICVLDKLVALIPTVEDEDYILQSYVASDK